MAKETELRLLTKEQLLRIAAHVAGVNPKLSEVLTDMSKRGEPGERIRVKLYSEACGDLDAACETLGIKAT